ncbi:MAG: DEAD/DEAH box helicase [Rhizomicrobium sp.]|nr:DEAD/DEAH box helicase [Rhizomicrobium sp.]
MTDITFESLGIAEPMVRALTEAGYVTPTPIQKAAIPELMSGRDLLALAQTGTGKTAAFTLPVMMKLLTGHELRKSRSVRALILAPTRELAIQIHDSVRAYGRHLHLKSTVIVGGVSQGAQVKAMSSGVDILVATPGRLLDHVNQGTVKLDTVTHLILDEGDRMLDMGFIRDIRKIVAALPKKRHSMLFSATMPADVEELSRFILHQPARIDLSPPKRTAENIDQRVCYVPAADKRTLLLSLLQDKAYERVLVFTRTKHVANRIAEFLDKNRVPADAIHGNKSQGARQRALSRFKAGEVRVLVATDIAARGIDIDEISHVINFELPNEAESYVHRIGRTARAGSSGIAISFCDATENAFLRDIERLTKSPLKIMQGEAAPDAPKAERNYANKKRPAYKPRDHSAAGKPRENNGGGQRRDAGAAGKPRSNSRPRRQASV